MCGKTEEYSNKTTHAAIQRMCEGAYHMKERGGVEADGQTGHGVGVEHDLLHDLYKDELSTGSKNLINSENNPLTFEKGSYAGSHIFLPKKSK